MCHKQRLGFSINPVLFFVRSIRVNYNFATDQSSMCIHLVETNSQSLHLYKQNNYFRNVSCLWQKTFALSSWQHGVLQNVLAAVKWEQVHYEFSTLLTYKSQIPLTMNHMHNKVGSRDVSTAIHRIFIRCNNCCIRFIICFVSTLSINQYLLCWFCQ